ncbi:hypothetical protein [Fischerella sp. JS2]|uniref:hypothetical protein n=1 Tax=Fischerella sp. JS2 TaxID=2597771 RepID=UPI0028E2BE2A|nr:hypothetical protein [Fischerella sp. JS2]
MSAGLVAVIFLWAGIFACIGWLIGTLILLFRTPSSGSSYEVRATVSQDTLVNVERELAQAGALDILSFTDGRYSYE